MNGETEGERPAAAELEALLVAVDRPPAVDGTGEQADQRRVGRQGLGERRFRRRRVEAQLLRPHRIEGDDAPPAVEKQQAALEADRERLA